MCNRPGHWLLLWWPADCPHHSSSSSGSCGASLPDQEPSPGQLTPAEQQALPQLGSQGVSEQVSMKVGDAGTDIAHGNSDVTAVKVIGSGKSAEVPTLSDMDASLVLVPAKKAYSKKKKIKPDA